MERQSKIMVVDDDQYALRSIVKVLEEDESYRVVAAASGSEAIDLLKQDSFDLVLTDLKMPEVDGLEVLRQAREIAPQAVVLILTGYAALESAVEALREGAYDYLVKPCSANELRLKIERGLERVRLAEERQRAEEEVRQRTAQLEALRRVGLEITTELDLDALLHSIASRAIELVGGTSGGLYLYRPNRDVLEWSVSVGPDLAPVGAVLHRGEGLSGRVWETGEPLISDDYQRWEGRAAIYEDYPFRAAVGVPVRWGEEFLGVLNVLADPPHTFSPADAELLGLFATQAAVAIRNARLYEETRQRALEQETVSRIAYALNAPDVRDAFPVLAKGLQNLTGCDMVSLIAMDEAGEQFITTVLESPFPIPGEGEVMPLSASVAAEDLEAGRPHLTADLSTETRFPLEQALYRAGLRSRVTLPLLVGGEVFGALNLGGSRTGLFREDQLPVLRQIADAVALAFQNSFIFLAEREQRELAEALEETTAALTATLDFDQVLDNILEQVSRVVPNDAANIMLIEGDQTRVVRWRGYERFGGEEFVSTVVLRIPEVPGFQQMLDSREPMVIPDIVVYPGWVRMPVTEWLRSYAAAPIVVRGEVIGFLNVDSATPGFFTQVHTEALRAFADHAAAALENARLYEAEQERRHIAETLRQASTVLSSTLELDEVLELILQQLRQVIPYDSASVQRLQDDALSPSKGEYLKIVACQGFEKPDKVVGLVFPLDPKFPNYRVVTTKAPLAIEDVVQDYPHFKDEADSYESGRIRSWLGVPLMVKDEIIGMIAVDRAEVRPYTAEESELAMAFANQAAIAIENARLFEETERLKAFSESVVQGVAEAILIEDAQGIITFANPAAEELLGYTREELIGQHWTTIVPEEQVEEVQQELAKRPQEIESRYEAVLLSKEGQVIPVIVGARPLFEDDEFVGVLSAFTDITERKRAEEQLAYMATHDPLTGVPNRRGFFTLAEQQLKMADRAKKRMVLLFADIDHLKQINDALGHPAGDRALIEVANVLKETFRESDIIARISGDEFVVLAMETDETSTEILTTRLRKNLEVRNARGDRPYRLSLSIGTTRYDPKHPCSIDELLAQADRAMYEQKRGSQKP